VTDQLNGLRFDIYERVHLPDDVAAIEELEEIELVPHMQALPQDDQVLLRGHLLLSGIYRTYDSSSVSKLEHWIPVEISLPLNRIQSVEELAVEIDNFDVDLLTSRSLNVTGVLALRGLQAQAQQTPIWRDDSFTVVHQAQLEAKDENDSDGIGEPERYGSGSASGQGEFEVGGELPSSEYVLGLSAKQDEVGRLDEVVEAADNGFDEEAKESSWLAMFPNLEEARKGKEEEPGQDAYDPFAPSLWGDVTKERLAEQVTLAEQPEEIVEEKSDVKVALSGKSPDSAVRLQSGVGLLSQLGEKGAQREAELRILEAAQAEEKALAASNNSLLSTGDELEWTRLFLNGGSEAQSFRKVKMCIVQREETLDLIATRYNVQSRELQLYNRLHDPYLSEGQVLYIP
jgi:stage VI sporulation protein D